MFAMPVEILLGMAFDAGYEAGAEDAGSGELLVETLGLRYALYDLGGKTRRAVALDDLVMAVSVETLEHEEGCRCGLCRHWRLLMGESTRRAWSGAAGKPIGDRAE